MQKIIAVGVVGKEITVQQKEATVQLDYNVVVKESRTNAEGESMQLSTLIRVSTLKKVSHSLSFIENLKAGVSVYVEGTVAPEFVEKEGKKFTAFRMKYSNTAYILGSKVSESFIKMEQIGYVGNAKVNTETPKEHVCNFSIAHNEKVNDSDSVIWTNCSFWKAPEKSRVFDYITKGKLVYITGYPRVSLYETGNGEKQLSLDCMVQNLELLSSAKPVSQQSNTGEQIDEIDEINKFDDLQF